MLAPRMPTTEQPFRPREKLVEQQKFFQSTHKYTHLKGPHDKINSVSIPLALAAASLNLIGEGSITCLMGSKRSNEKSAFVQK